MFNIIVATDNYGSVGMNNELPWKISEDLLYFKKVTIGLYKPSDPVLEKITCQDKNIVIMGRNTFESFSTDKMKFLKDRINVIISNSLYKDETALNNFIKKYNIKDFYKKYIFIYPSLDTALEFYEKKSNYIPNMDPCIENNSEIYVIGGEMLYNEAFNHPNLDKIYLTKIFINDDNYPQDYYKQKCTKFINIPEKEIEIEILYNKMQVNTYSSVDIKDKNNPIKVKIYNILYIGGSREPRFPT